MEAWKFFLPFVLMVAIYVGIFFDWYIGVWVINGYLLHGFGIDPDLDLISISRSESLWTKWIIPIPLLGWSALYARIFSNWGGHRSLWTHGFFISSAIRLLYFAFPFLYFYRTYFSHGDLVKEFIGLFIGLSVADNIHIILDMITGEFRAKHKIGGKSKFAKIIIKFLFDPTSRR